jgi:hypothetical protein
LLFPDSWSPSVTKSNSDLGSKIKIKMLVYQTTHFGHIFLLSLQTICLCRECWTSSPMYWTELLSTADLI